VSSRLIALALVGLAIALVPVALQPIAIHASALNAEFYMYGMSTCPHCRALHELLVKTFGSSSVYFCGINHCEYCRRRLLELYKIIGMEPVVPLTVVVCNGCVKAIVIGEVDDVGFWRSIVSSNHSSYRVPVYAGTSLFEYLVFNDSRDLREFTISVAPQLFSAPSNMSVKFSGYVIRVSHGGSKVSGTAIGSVAAILPTMVLLALSDSVNPCALYLYVVLLLAAALSAYAGGSRIKVRNVLIVGLSFVVAIYVGYVSIGFGLLKALSYVPMYSKIAAAIAIGFGGWTIATGVARKSRVAGKGFVLSWVPRAASSAAASFALGLLVTFTLLPCSAGPYVLFVSLVLKELGSAYFAPLVLLYNLVFVSPMLAILGAVTSVSKLESVQRFIISNGDKLSVASGLILVALGIYVFLL